MRGGRLNWQENNSFDWPLLSDSQGRWQHGQQDTHTGVSASGRDGSLLNDLQDGWLVNDSQDGWLIRQHDGNSAGWHRWHESHDHGGTPAPDPVPTPIPTPPVNGSPDPSMPPGDGETPVPP